MIDRLIDSVILGDVGAIVFVADLLLHEISQKIDYLSSLFVSINCTKTGPRYRNWHLSHVDFGLVSL